jgi:predicted alpha/beta-hydrolase family hydrolase
MLGIGISIALHVRFIRGIPRSNARWNPPVSIPSAAQYGASAPNLLITSKPENWDGDVAVILSHGAGQGIDSAFMQFFHTDLARRGFLSAAFNFEYMERKRKIPDPQPKMQALYRDVIERVKREFGPRRIFIGGKSMGGRVASYIAKDAAGVHGLIFLGYPLHPPGQPDKQRDAHLYEIALPMLFLSGSKDAFADHDLLEEVARKLGDRATLVWTEGGDHSLNIAKRKAETWAEAAARIESWIRRL